MHTEADLQTMTRDALFAAQKLAKSELGKLERRLRKERHAIEQDALAYANTSIIRAGKGFYFKEFQGRQKVELSGRERYLRWEGPTGSPLERLYNVGETALKGINAEKRYRELKRLLWNPVSYRLPRGKTPMKSDDHDIVSIAHEVYWPGCYAEHDYEHMFRLIREIQESRTN